MNKTASTHRVYYLLKPLIPRRVQLLLRRQLVVRKRRMHEHGWPILEKAGEPPAGWTAWPNQRRFALVLTHDVESEIGQRRCHRLMNLEKQAGFCSSFNFVPERYTVLPEVRRTLTDNGFEVGVHGLKHDGKLYQARSVFRERVCKINSYLKEWNAVGFRSPAAHHNLDWIHDLDIEYDSSTFDTDPFEPQPDGIQTVFPFWVQGIPDRGGGYVELPYTLPQDFLLFVLMREQSTAIWRRKLDWIAAKGGMALVITHPDYMNLDGSKLGPEEYVASHYQEFLDYVKTTYNGQYWHALPQEVAAFVRRQAEDLAR
jgi:peptidoglycan/xylan/chitin deacetylase (PgdA/CDA1 family)